MAWQSYYLGSVGPLLYEDTDIYVGTLQTHMALYSPGGGFYTFTGAVASAPVAGEDVLRLDDMPWPVNPPVADVTGSRVIGGIYQNTTNSLIKAQISCRLSN
jgi:hypothetical protein